MGIQRPSATSFDNLPGRTASGQPARSASKGNTRSGAPKRRSDRPRVGLNPLKYLGIDDSKLALLIAPDRYVDCTRFTHSIHDVAQDQRALFRLTLTGTIRAFGSGKDVLFCVPDQFVSISQAPPDLLRQTRRLELDASDDAGNEVVITTFSRSGTWANSKAGDVHHVEGSYRKFGKRTFFKIDQEVPERAVGRVWAQYGFVSGQFSSERVALAIAGAKIDPLAWNHCAAHIARETGMAQDQLLTRTKSSFASLQELLQALHEPATLDIGYAAMEDARRINALAVQVAAVRSTSTRPHPRAPITIDAQALTRLIGLQQENLTDDQLAAVHRMRDRLGQPQATSTLLTGDVGSGKTLAYLLPAVAAHLAGAQVAIIAPTSLLVDQITQQIIRRFGSEVRGVQRIDAGDVISNPGHLLVGTTGMVTSARKSAWKPNLLICDEQHKMGAATRESLLADWTHLLEVSATPIPRSLAMALYDGMEIISLKQSPHEKHIQSTVLDMKQKKWMLGMTKSTLERNERCAFVYPVIKQGGWQKTGRSEEDVDIESTETVHTVESTFHSLDTAFPGKVVMLHGKMRQEDLRAGLELMRTGARQIMVASTVIETGLDIPSLSLMIVRNADRFGISQLHQLRGRLARQGGEATFVMAVEDFSDFPNQEDESPHETLQRLEAVAATNDGYELAELDLHQRGFGNFLSTQQSGAARTVFPMLDLKVEDFISKRLGRQGSQDEARHEQSTNLPDEPPSVRVSAHRGQF